MFRCLDAETFKYLLAEHRQFMSGFVRLLSERALLKTSADRAAHSARLRGHRLLIANHRLAQVGPPHAIRFAALVALKTRVDRGRVKATP